MNTNFGYYTIPPNLTNNCVELSRLLEGFGSALMQTINSPEQDVQVTLTFDGAIVLASALFEVVNQLRDKKSEKSS